MAKSLLLAIKAGAMSRRWPTTWRDGQRRSTADSIRTKPAASSPSTDSNLPTGTKGTHRPTRAADFWTKSERKDPTRTRLIGYHRPFYGYNYLMCGLPPLSNRIQRSLKFRYLPLVSCCCCCCWMEARAAAAAATLALVLSRTGGRKVDVFLEFSGWRKSANRPGACWPLGRDSRDFSDK